MSEALTKETFINKVFDYENNKDWKFSGDLPAVVDFWAPWCGPCRMVGPIVEQLAREYAGKVAFGKLNVDENPMVAGSFGIQSIPTMIAFQNGKAVDGLLGAVPKAQIEKLFKPYMENM